MQIWVLHNEGDYQFTCDHEDIIVNLQKHVPFNAFDHANAVHLYLDIDNENEEGIIAGAEYFHITIEFSVGVTLTKDYGMASFEREFAIDTSDMSAFADDLADTNIAAINSLFINADRK